MAWPIDVVYVGKKCSRLTKLGRSAEILIPYNIDLRKSSTPWERMAGGRFRKRTVLAEDDRFAIRGAAMQPRTKRHRSHERHGHLVRG